MSAVRISVIFSLGRRYGLRAACAAAESDGSPNIPASGMAELFKRDLRLMGVKGNSTGSVLQFQAQITFHTPLAATRARDLEAMGGIPRHTSSKAVSGQLPYGRPYARDQRVVFRLRFFRGCLGKRGGPPPSVGFGERQADVLSDKARDLRCQHVKIDLSLEDLINDFQKSISEQHFQTGDLLLIPTGQSGDAGFEIDHSWDRI